MNSNKHIQIKKRRGRRPVQQVIRQHALLKAFMAHSNHLKKLEDLVANHLRNITFKIARHSAHTLFIYVDHQAYATQLRFIAPELVKQLKMHEEFKHLNKITIKISMDHVHSKPSTGRKLAPLSEQNANLFQNTALLCQDEQLKNSLLRLSAHRATKQQAGK